MQFIISVALHVCPLICATKEKQTMMLTVLYQTNCKLHKFTTPRGSGVGGGGWWGQKPCIEPIESGAERSRSGFLVLL